MSIDAKFITSAAGWLLAWVAATFGPAPIESQSLRPMIAMGDSITSGLGDDGVDCDDPSTFAGYPSRLLGALAAQGMSVDLRNVGICGETTAAALSRIDDVVSSAIDVGLMLLMEGTNDISVGVSNETIRFNLNEMARRGDDYRLETVFASVIPRGPEAGRDGNNAIAFGLSELMRADAQAQGRPFAEAFDSLFEQPEVFDLLYSDTFHPNAEGYDILAGAFVAPATQAWSAVGQPDSGPCAASASRLCLNQGRFSIVVDWTKPNGERGIGLAEPLTSDTGTFYFFRQANIELVIKVLDGRNNNGHFWVFYGALSNVAYTITVRDSQTEAVKKYVNPPGAFASVGDTTAFAAPGESMLPAVVRHLPVRQPASLTVTPRGVTACVEDMLTLCLSEGRFAVRVHWIKPDGEEGEGVAQPRTADTGTFYFFRDTNIELIVKLLDGRNNNGHFWVFFGALSNVEYEMTVTDTATGIEKAYTNPPGTFASVGDTEAFPVPPGG